MDSQESLIWPLVLLAPLCLVFLRDLDRLVFRAPASPREPPLWSGAHITALFLFWFAAHIFIGSLVGALDPDLPPSEFQFLVFSGVLVTTLLFVGSYFRASGQPVATLGFRGTSWVNLLIVPLFYLLSMIVLQPVFLGWEALLRALGATVEEQDTLQEFRAVVEAGDSARMVLFAASATVLAPMTEEIIFRGVFFGGLVDRWGFLPAALFSSLFFGAVHFSLSAFFPLVLVGVVLCYLYRKTGSIYPSMTYHAIFNGVTLLITILLPPMG